MLSYIWHGRTLSGDHGHQSVSVLYTFYDVGAVINLGAGCHENRKFIEKQLIYYYENRQWTRTNPAHNQRNNINIAQCYALSRSQLVISFILI